MTSNTSAVIGMITRELELGKLIPEELAKQLLDICMKQEQSIQELTHCNQVLENLHKLQRNCRCKCVSSTEFYRALHGKGCHCSWCDPAGN